MTPGVRGPELVQPEHVKLERQVHQPGGEGRVPACIPSFPTVTDFVDRKKRHAKLRLKSCQTDESDSPAGVYDLPTWHKILCETLLDVLRISATGDPI